MTENELRARALAAASTARFAGFFETSKALIILANKCECGGELLDSANCCQDTAAWYLEENSKPNKLQ